jgi:hypothetical protein
MMKIPDPHERGKTDDLADEEYRQNLRADTDAIEKRLRDYSAMNGKSKPSKGNPPSTAPGSDGAEESAPGKVPIPAENAWPDPPGDEAFHGLPGRIVRTIEPASEADPAALLIQTLVMFGNVTGRGPHSTVEGTRHHVNENAVAVGRTSKARKGTSWGRIFGLFEQAEEQWAAGREVSYLA